MSGSDSDRSDSGNHGSSQGEGKTGGQGGQGGQPDACLTAAQGPINSPQADVLRPLSEGTVLNIRLDESGVAPVLAVETPDGRRAGSLTFSGYLRIVGCMRRGYQYEATIMHIDGGVYEVRVTPL